MRVILKASDVAAIIGRNKYKSRREILDTLWKKYSPGTFTGKTKDEKVRDTLAISPEAQNILTKAVEIKAKDSSDVINIFQKAQEAINFDPKLDQSQKNEVIDHLRSAIYTTHGTRSEDITSDLVEKTNNVKLVRDDAFYFHEVCSVGDMNFVVCGKIDRIEECPDGKKVLVEIKNRTNRLFGHVVDYEMIQVQTYLQMLGLMHARLVEQHNARILVHDITRDEDMWYNEIQPGLEAFCQELAIHIAK